jgi:hypothetical protein
VCVQIRQEIAATAKIEHAESSLTSYNVPNTPSGHNRPTVLQEGPESCIIRASLASPERRR